MSHYHTSKKRSTRALEATSPPHHSNESELAKLVGRRIQSERVGQDIGLSVISETGGLTPSHLSLLERGLVNPLARSIVRMAGLLDCHPALLLVDEETIRKAWEFWEDPPAVIIDEQKARFFAVIVVLGMDRDAAVRLGKTLLSDVNGGEGGM